MHIDIFLNQNHQIYILHSFSHWNKINVLKFDLYLQLNIVPPPQKKKKKKKKLIKIKITISIWLSITKERLLQYHEKSNCMGYENITISLSVREKKNIRLSSAITKKYGFL